MRGVGYNLIMETQEKLPESELSRSEAKRLRAADAARRKNIKKWLWGGGAALAAAVLVASGVWYARSASQNLPGEPVPAQGEEHVALNYQFTYNSNPPTSGPHYGSPANWGVYDYEVNDKFFIHNMEHGGVWIAYRSTLATSTVDDLKAVVQEFGGSKIVMAPRSANDSDIAVAAWTRLLKINLAGGGITEEQRNQIRAFYRAFKNKGPEFVPDTMPGADPKAVQK